MFGNAQFIDFLIIVIQKPACVTQTGFCKLFYPLPPRLPPPDDLPPPIEPPPNDLPPPKSELLGVEMLLGESFLGVEIDLG